MKEGRWKRRLCRKQRTKKGRDEDEDGSPRSQAEGERKKNEVEKEREEVARWTEKRQEETPK